MKVIFHGERPRSNVLSYVVEAEDLKPPPDKPSRDALGILLESFRNFFGIFWNLSGFRKLISRILFVVRVENGFLAPKQECV